VGPPLPRAHGPYGPERTERALPIPRRCLTSPPGLSSPLCLLPLLFPPAGLEEGLRRPGLRHRVEQSSTQVTHAPGWSPSHVRQDHAIRRQWQVVCDAFSLCWYHASYGSSQERSEPQQESEPDVSSQTHGPADEEGTRKKICEGKGGRPQISWPMALRAVRAWLEPWILLRRSWQGWSPLPPPPVLPLLLAWLEQGHALALSSSA
jgi:hypothetical protein